MSVTVCLIERSPCPVQSTVDSYNIVVLVSNTTINRETTTHHSQIIPNSAVVKFGNIIARTTKYKYNKTIEV